MPTYEITTPSGQRFEVTAPDGATEAEVLAYAQKNAPMSAKERVETDSITRGAKEFAKAGGSGISQAALDLLAGAVRGAGSIGATLMAPIDYAEDAIRGDRGKNLSSLVTGKELPSRNAERRVAMDAALSDLGADTDSLTYKGGKIATEIAGTAGVGNVLAAPARAISGLSQAAGAGAIPALETAATALASGGFRTGAQLGTAANIATRAGAGAITGGAAAGMVDPKDAGTGAIIGGVAPGVVRALGSAGTAVRSALIGKGVAPEVAALAGRARDLGIIIPADRIAQSKPLDAAASALNYVPFSGRAATEDLMEKQLNRALSRTFGQNSSNVTGALRAAGDKLGNKFDQFLKANNVVVDQPFLTDLADVANKATRELASDQAGIITRQVDEIIAKGANGALDGQAAYNIKRTLDRIGRRNSPEAWYGLELKGKLMEALNRSVGPAAADGFATLRQQYGNMLSLEKLAKNGVEGDISVARLANLQNINNQQLQELADIAAQFVKPRESQHGAMQRAVVGAATFGMGGPVGLATGAATGRIANAALNSETMREAVLKGGGAIPASGSAPMGAIAGATQRALPVGGAAIGSAMMAPAGATGESMPPAPLQSTPGIASPLTHDGRPAVQNPDGTHSTELTITVQDERLNGNLPTNIPSLWGGAVVDQETAIQNAVRSGRQFQPYETIEEAVRAARARSAAGGAVAPLQKRDPIAQISQAPDLNTAIDGAMRAVDSAAEELLAGRVLQEQPVAPTPPAPVRKVELPPAVPGGAQPVAIWTGRRGGGYVTEEDAQRALPTRQRTNPDLQWEIEEMPNGLFRLAAYQAEQTAEAASGDDGSVSPGQQVATAPQPVAPDSFRARMTPAGTLAIEGDPQRLRAALTQLGFSAIPTRTGVVVAASQAKQALELLQDIAA